MMSTSEEDIYQEHVMDHYEDPYHRGDLRSKTHHGTGKNPLCGDVVSVNLEIDEKGIIRQAYFDGQGCCISQASASMLMEAVEGKTVEEVTAMGATEMLDLFGPKLTPNRQKCCLLPWRVLQTAVFSPVGEQ